MSIRGDRFKQVAGAVHKHIETYTIPRYGDAPNDMIEGMKPPDCMLYAAKYNARFPAPEREKGDRKIDCLKAIHMLAETYLKLIDGELEDQPTELSVNRLLETSSALSLQAVATGDIKTVREAIAMQIEACTKMREIENA